MNVHFFPIDKKCRARKGILRMEEKGIPRMREKEIQNEEKKSERKE